MFLKAFESIVVGIDFSTYSQTVVKQALRLAELWEAKLVLVHAFNEPVSVKGNYYFPPMKQMSQSDYIEQIKDYYDLKKNNIEFVVKCDAPHRLLRVVAKKQKRPLMVLLPDRIADDELKIRRVQDYSLNNPDEYKAD